MIRWAETLGRNTLGNTTKVAGRTAADASAPYFRNLVDAAGNTVPGIAGPTTQSRLAAWVHERPPCGDVFPFAPGRSFDPPDAPQKLLAWAEAEAARLLAPSGNPAHDRARGLNLRVPRKPLIADLNAHADLADELYRALS